MKKDTYLRNFACETWRETYTVKFAREIEHFHFTLRPGYQKSGKVM